MTSELDDNCECQAETLPEVPDDGILIKTLYVGVCHVTHSPQDKLDLANFVGWFILLSPVGLNVYTNATSSSSYDITCNMVQAQQRFRATLQSQCCQCREATY